MIIIFSVIAIQISFLTDIYYIISYISKRENKYLRGFFAAAVITISISIFMSIFVFLKPGEFADIHLERFLIIESGFIFIIMLYIKARVTIRIYRRTQDPEHYHISYFGKKVIHPSAVTTKDLVTYFLTMPFTLLCGAYFIVKLGCGK